MIKCILKEAQITHSELSLFRRLVFRSTGSDGSEGYFRSSESAVKQRPARQCREWLHTL